MFVVVEEAKLTFTARAGGGTKKYSKRMPRKGRGSVVHQVCLIAFR